MAKQQIDQAEGLRKMSMKPVNVIAVTSGKGGVGKTNLAVNIGVSLAKEGKNVMLFDADLGLANVDVLLNLHPKYNLSHVMSGERTLAEVIVEGPGGLKIIPAASGSEKMSQLSPAENAGLIQAFSELQMPLDNLIIDTAAGINDTVISFIRASKEVVVVVCDEPASLTDAYALIKVLSRDYNVDKYHVLSNMVRSVVHGQDLFNKLYAVTGRFLSVTLEHLGSIPYDDYLKRSLQKQSPVVLTYPSSRSGMAFTKIAQKISKWPVPKGAEGHLEFFVERLIQYSNESED